jgi:hypothetical protein
MTTNYLEIRNQLEESLNLSGKQIPRPIYTAHALEASEQMLPVLQPVRQADNGLENGFHL